MRSLGWPELLLILALLVLLFGGKRIPELGKGLGRALRLFKSGWRGEEEATSAQREVALGQKWKRRMEPLLRVLDDDRVVAYVNQVAQRIAAGAALRWPVAVKVVEDRCFNAFALPGGLLYVNTGLMLRVNSEAELASALAHELAHSALRHALRDHFRRTAVKWASVPLGFVRGWFGKAAREASGLAVELACLKHSREDELEADCWALEHLLKAGYHPRGPQALLETMQALERAEPGVLSRAFSTHPPVTERSEVARQKMRDLALPPHGPAAHSAEFAQVRLHLLRREAERDARGAE